MPLLYPLVEEVRASREITVKLKAPPPPEKPEIPTWLPVVGVAAIAAAIGLVAISKPKPKP